MFKKTTWMSKGYIAQAVKKLTEVKVNEFGYYSKAQREGAEEGLACLNGAKPEYLSNLIKADHPDRIMALRLLTE